MRQDERDLLLRDLCARLPYRVKASYDNGDILEERELGIGSLHDFMFNNAIVRPYLRPMSSMTDDEVRMYHELCEFDDCDYTGRETYFITVEAIDYLASIHVDYRNLIDKGLALEAPAGMYNEKEK